MGKKTAEKKRGPHPHKALSAVSIRRLHKPGYYADGNGLYLQVARGGSKSWICRVVISGKRCEIGCGGLAYTTLPEARQKAIDIRKAARNGDDPLREKHEQRAAALRESNMPTFETAAREVHGEHSKTFRN